MSEKLTDEFIKDFAATLIRVELALAGLRKTGAALAEAFIKAHADKARD